MKLFINLLLFTSLLSFTNYNGKEKIRWTILPIENAKKIFEQCSRERPKYKKVIILEDNIYIDAINLLKSKLKSFKEKAKINIEDYTIQLVGYKTKCKSFIYFNANITDLEDEKKQKWKEHPIIWCDGNSSSWGIVYDIEQKELIDFITNGPTITRINKI